jgi:hypothetical protein
MKQTIEVPYSIGDIGWSILERFDKKNVHCKSCNHSSSESTHLTEVRECQIDIININIANDGEISFWYKVGFDLGENNNGEKYPGHGRFTYGLQVSKIFSSYEEAKDYLTKGLK